MIDIFSRTVRDSTEKAQFQLYKTEGKFAQDYRFLRCYFYFLRHRIKNNNEINWIHRWGDLGCHNLQKSLIIKYRVLKCFWYWLKQLLRVNNLLRTYLPPPQ